jgi:photosystem II stability/assembly factor-like uncharacterized protein
LNDGKIILSTDQGLIQSDINQTNYTPLPEIPYSVSKTKQVIALDANHLFAMDGEFSSFLYGSNDAGKSWNKIKEENVVDVAAFNHELIMLNYNDSVKQILKSNDLGQTWQPVYQIQRSHHCDSLSSQHGGLFVNCTQESYFTRDLINWYKVETESQNNHVSSYFSGKNLYISDGHFVKYSNDNGKTWITLLDNLNQYQGLIAGYNDDLLVIAINSAGIIKMSDGTWDLINDGLDNYNFTSLVVIDQNHYLVSTHTGIYLTQDGGKHWKSANKGLDNINILSLFANQNTVLAGSSGSGVFKAILN